ncbi:PI-actitoxin-Aeq3b, partial [Desmophyllum pertusum]
MAQTFKSRDPSICELPKEVGECRGAFPKFYYNKETGECENFIYGGCDGNQNNFDTKEECERKCKSGYSR